jgi:Flp pilus assembly protein TadG
MLFVAALHGQRARRVLARCRSCGDGVHLTRRDRGSSAIELVLLAPMVFLLTFLPIQGGLILQARHVVTAAAQEGARAARTVDLDAGQAQAAGAQRATDFTAMLGGNMVHDTTVTVNRGPEQVRVVVTGNALAILPGFKLAVRGTSVSPVERFSAP